MKLSGDTIDPSEGFRAQPAILNYRADQAGGTRGKTIRGASAGEVQN